MTELSTWTAILLLKSPDWLSVRNWPWLGLLLAIILAVGISRILRRIGGRILERVMGPVLARSNEHLLDALAAPIRALVLVGITQATIDFLNLPPVVQKFWNAAFVRLLIVITAWLLIRIVRMFAKVLNQRLARLGRPDSTAIVGLIQRTVSVVLVFLAIVLLLRSAGFDVTAMLAGLGVGGIALAFAAQRTLENLFAGVSIILDEPVRIGDYCKIGTYEGTVEDIGLRSTRLRTLDRTVVTVPNGQLSTMNMENMGMRDKMWFRHAVRLSLETTPDQLEQLIDSFLQLLKGHERVEPSTARARFVRLGPDAIEIDLAVYVLTTNVLEFLRIQEELLFGILKAVEASGTSIAFPFRAAILNASAAQGEGRAARRLPQSA
jgi:MscS family membrane protein